MLKKGRGYLLACVAVAAVSVLLLLSAAPDPTPADSSNPAPATPSAPTTPSSSIVQAAPIGDRVHISGCDFGVLRVPIVDLWDSAERTRVVGEVSGDGPTDRGLRCLGTVVIIRSIDSDQPTTMYEVEAVVGNQRGWLSELFIGPIFDISLCGAFFSHSSAAAGKCRG